MLQKRWFRALFRYRFYITVLLAVQAAFMIYVIFSTGRAAVWIGRALSLLSFFVALHIVMRKTKGAYKLMWVFLILLFPLFGGILYLLFTYQSSMFKVQKYAENILKKTAAYSYARDGVCADAQAKMPVLKHSCVICRHVPDSRPFRIRGQSSAQRARRILRLF